MMTKLVLTQQIRKELPTEREELYKKLLYMKHNLYFGSQL